MQDSQEESRRIEYELQVGSEAQIAQTSKLSRLMTHRKQQMFQLIPQCIQLVQQGCVFSAGGEPLVD